MLRSSLLMALLFAAGAAQAQGVLTEKNISLDLANRLAAETVKQCSAKGYNVSAAVVDRAGVLRALQRADQAGRVDLHLAIPVGNDSDPHGFVAACGPRIRWSTISSGEVARKALNTRPGFIGMEH